MTTVDARTAGLPGQGAQDRPALFVDAGVGHFRFQAQDERGQALFDVTLPSNSNLVQLAAYYRLRERFGSGPDAAIFITGKLATLVKEALGGGKTILPAAAAWMAGRRLIRQAADVRCGSQETRRAAPSVSWPPGGRTPQSGVFGGGHLP